ncbi:unnamed protein product [Dovyalis caffra]|uniref:Uncharacterized protein n=1 Tax=Dovyalis caffra TaxID=77055 RepID=A0AAV1S5M1_9ROSI|nr:unnamed protein product [Dovyalis caffra]
MVGALAGLPTKKGILHGAIAGAASGVILSKEILNLLLAMWDSDNTAMTCFFSLVGVVHASMQPTRNPFGGLVTLIARHQLMKIENKFPSSCSASSLAFWVSAIACKLSCAILTFVFAVVGTTLGAYSGAVVGLKSKSSLLHGITVGAVMGCVLSVEILRKSFVLWDSDDWATGCFIHFVSFLIAPNFTNDFRDRKVLPLISLRPQQQYQHTGLISSQPRSHVRSTDPSSKTLNLVFSA